MPAPAEIREYLDKSGDTAFRWNLPMAEFAGGWYNFDINEAEKTFVIWQAYGKAKAIKAHAVNLAHHFGCERIVYVATTRGQASARLFGGKVLGTLIEVRLWAKQSEE